MKKIVCVVLMIVFAIVAFAQQPDTKLELSKQDYLQKAGTKKLPHGSCWAVERQWLQAP